MLEILTAEQSRQADALTVEGGTPGLRLMEAAGAAVAQKIMSSRPAPCPVLVLCGPGNNGGDGFVAARRLKEAGWPVRLACCAGKNTLKNDAALAAKTWEGVVEELNSNLSLKDAGLVVDAVFGTGFSGALAPEIVILFDKIRARKTPVVAVDLPSGLDATAATAAPGTLAAALTVTFTRKKPAHVLLPGRTLCGAVQVAQVGVTDASVALSGATVFENDPALWLKDFPLPGPESHKYTRGHVVVLAGKNRPGAACLAARAAQKAGAGAVTLAVPAGTALPAFPASLMTDRWESAGDFKSILRDTRRNAVVIGPGAGTDADAREIVDAALAFGRPGVLDGDVFTLYRDSPAALFEKLSADRHVLTPHEGEFARLFPDLSSGSKIQRAQAAARRSGAVVLLKGADTVIAAPDGTAIVNTKAPATLATAGSGDVLAGIVAGLIAQSMLPFMAAASGCWLQADSARRYGLGLTAEDLIATLNQSLNAIFAPST